VKLQYQKQGKDATIIGTNMYYYIA